jgi:uncharacterized protein YceH (UPF0502 family)
MASENALFLDIVGGRNKKGYVYGLGQLGDEFVASSTQSHQSDSTTMDYQQIIAKLNAELAAKDTRIERMDSQLQKTSS